METILYFDFKSIHTKGSSQHMTVDFNPPLLLGESKQHEIALINAYVWYSWFNITSKNNQFKFYDGTKWSTLEIPPGADNIADINKYIKKPLPNRDGTDIQPNYNTLHSDITLTDDYQIYFTLDLF